MASHHLCVSAVYIKPETGAGKRVAYPAGRLPAHTNKRQANEKKQMDDGVMRPGLGGVHDACLGVAIIRPDQRVTEVASIVSKWLISGIESQVVEIQFREHGNCPGITLFERMHLPNMRNKFRQMPYVVS